MKLKYYMLSALSLVCLCGCNEREAPLPDPLPAPLPAPFSEDPFAVSVEINFIEDREETVAHLLDTLTVLAEMGHWSILINDTYFLFDCLPEWAVRTPNTNTALTVNFPLDHKIKNFESEIKTIAEWIKTEKVEGVAISFGERLPMRTALSVLHYLNQNKIYFALMKTPDETTSVFMKLDKIKYPIL